MSPCILRLSGSAYRRFHALAKREAGVVVSVQSFTDLGAWGRFSRMADSVIKNAAAPKDVQVCDEVACITLASRINVAKLHAATRPEMDWSAIPNPLVYEFIFWHEVGHRIDNFDEWDFILSEYRQRPDFAKWRHFFSRANEVLADRYAWNKLFPGRPIVVAARHSAAYLREVHSQIELLSKSLPRGKYKVRQLPLGPAEYIPSRMLEDVTLARLAGFAPLKRATGPESRDRAVWREAYAASRVGPRRPTLETVDGDSVGCVAREGYTASEFSVQLSIGRDCPVNAAVAAAAQYGFMRHEIETFMAGSRPISPEVRHG